MPPNFYYHQEDYLVTRQAGRGWIWSASLFDDYQQAGPLPDLSGGGAS